MIKKVYGPNAISLCFLHHWHISEKYTEKFEWHSQLVSTNLTGIQNRMFTVWARHPNSYSAGLLTGKGNDKWTACYDPPPGPGKEGCSVEGRVLHRCGCRVSPLTAVWWFRSFPFPPWSPSATTWEIYKCFHFRSH